jgi:hypothetical protein
VLSVGVTPLPQLELDIRALSGTSQRSPQNSQKIPQNSSRSDKNEIYTLQRDQSNTSVGSDRSCSPPPPPKKRLEHDNNNNEQSTIFSSLQQQNEFNQQQSQLGTPTSTLKPLMQLTLDTTHPNQQDQIGITNSNDSKLNPNDSNKINNNQQDQSNDSSHHNQPDSSLNQQNQSNSSLNQQNRSNSTLNQPKLYESPSDIDLLTYEQFLMLDPDVLKQEIIEKHQKEQDKLKGEKLKKKHDLPFLDISEAKYMLYKRFQVIKESASSHFAQFLNVMLQHAEILAKCSLILITFFKQTPPPQQQSHQHSNYQHQYGNKFNYVNNNGNQQQNGEKIVNLQQNQLNQQNSANSATSDHIQLNSPFSSVGDGTVHSLDYNLQQKQANNPMYRSDNNINNKDPHQHQTGPNNDAKLSKSNTSPYNQSSKDLQTQLENQQKNKNSDKNDETQRKTHRKSKITPINEDEVEMMQLSNNNQQNQPGGKNSTSGDRSTNNSRSDDTEDNLSFNTFGYVLLHLDDFFAIQNFVFSPSL